MGVRKVSNSKSDLQGHSRSPLECGMKFLMKKKFMKFSNFSRPGFGNFH